MVRSKTKNNITTITRNGKTKYQIAFMYRKQRFKRTFTMKKDAQLWEREVKHQIDTKGYYKECNLKLKEIIDQWWNIKKDTLATATQVTYETTIRKLKSYKVMNTQLIDINYMSMQNLFIQLAKDGNNKGTCDNCKKVLNGAFRFAIRSQFISHNPLDGVENRGVETNSPGVKKVVTDAEFEALCNHFINNEDFKNHSIYILLMIGIYTGARITEAIAVTWDDVDFEKKTLTLDKRYDKMLGKATDKMKTKASKKTMCVSHQLIDTLKWWKKRNHHAIICCDKDGSYLNPNSIETTLSRTGKKLGFKFHYHMLRHTYGSKMAANNVPIKVLQANMRHGSIRMTMDTYIHSDDDQERAAIERTFGHYFPKITPND